METSATTPRDDTTDAPHQDPVIDPAAHAAPQQQQQQQQHQFPDPVQSPSQPAQSVLVQPEGATSHATPSATNVPDPGQPSENESSVIDKGPGILHLHQDIHASPRHELELIPEDHPISTPHHLDTGIVSPRAASSTFTGSNHASAASTPDTGAGTSTGIVRPVAHPLPSRPSTRSPISSISPVEEPLSPAIIRTASGRSRLRHPTPDINARSGSYTSNIAALEATAERFSMTSSIDDAIREAHNDLKRSDSRRSSILAASVRSGDYGTDSSLGVLPPLPLGQQSSIVGLNNAARTGGYSPGGFIMSPTQSITGRLRSASKGSSALSRANSTRSKPETLEGEAFPNLSGSMMSSISRNGPGSGSIRSVRSVRSMHSVHSVQSNRSGPPLSLAEIAEMEPPSALTRAAMDEADRTVPNLEDLGDDDEAILARAHQQVEPDATDIQVAEEPNQQLSRDWDGAPMMEEANDSYWDSHDEASTLQIRNLASPMKPNAQGAHEPPVEQGHEDCETPDTVDEANVFADFDGMHCDPDIVAQHFPFHPEEEGNTQPGQAQAQMQRRPPAARSARPQSYFDAATGQNMLYYPAHVPAMLNLPPKLGKGVKAAEAARNMRRSQLLSQMPKKARESRSWLPDPLEDAGSLNLSPMPLMGDAITPTSQQSSIRDLGPEHALAALEHPGTGPASHGNSPVEALGSQNLRRPPKLGDSDARKSKMNLSELPPQLRASAFFDMPNTSVPKLEVKNGSAMDTLDSILDAAASAPVNAFTDHAIAGHLGNEVYGNKKKNRQSQLTLAAGAGEGKTHRLSKSASMLALPEVEKRKSMWSLLPGRGKSRSSVNLLNVQEADARSRLSGSGGGDDSASDVDENSALAPDNESSSDEEPELFGQPTTLLAELQMRKQHQKKRTINPLHQGNVLHSTLLELDAVAQHEAESRQKKQVNLAWAADSPEAESEDDEDVPLGLLAARKQLGANATDHEMALAAQEFNRPLGLMEKRELDDNEPLSRRRDRLQGKPVTVSMYLQPSGNGTRLSVMHGSHSRSASPLRMARVRSPGASATSPTPEEDEVQGETLGERMRRLRAKEDGDNPLPRARPVSGSFSTELLGELGIGEKDKDTEKDKENAAPVIEEEETLGQRRRRLQAEREAREKEMGVHAVQDDNQKGTLSRRLSMADVLAANPLAVPGQEDPREMDRRRKQEEASQYAREHEAKMRAFRAQIPQAISDGRGGVLVPGGYQNGRFNDSRGGLGNPIQATNSGNHLRGSMSMGQLGMQGHPTRGQSTNLIGAAGTYNNPNADPNGVNPAFTKSNPFGNGYSGGILQSHPQFSNPPQPFVSGTLLASGGYGAYGGGIGAAGGYPANQTAYGAGVGYAGGMPVGYGMHAGGMQMMTGQQQADLVERWRQGIR